MPHKDILVSILFQKYKKLGQKACANPIREKGCGQFFLLPMDNKYKAPYL